MSAGTMSAGTMSADTMSALQLNETAILSDRGFRLCY